ncbi:endo alpha-1,4 polygalactosaminidase [Enhygromyxa salina]|uniref:Glycoside-hydrolase family GH114 TIM-barrel domain-containing protein n=1 Tax=Enhygromyxa salina TaxID=215803 RepID=A0A2S9Y7Y5_9BACT|nr:endo alpha-1,4 polygalactosaminidase [Enhygromyxa salina]PRQ01224.1 hypothetical protein ENSA7_58290 [Enhygromyxa salina]
MRASISTALLVFVGACVDNQYPPLDPAVDPLTEGEWYRPTTTTTWQWQLQVREGQAGLNTSYAVDVYDLDLFDVSAEQIAALQDQDRRVICYFSAGSWEEWREDADAFDRADLGAKLDGWAGERWLNIRSPKVMEIMLARLDLAVQRGCDGVEPDNVDAYTNHSGFELLAEDQLAYNRALANAAHTRGLAIGLKNAGDQAVELVDYYDFSLNEQCHEYDECAQLQPFTQAGKPIWNAEYVSPDNLATAQAAAFELCPRAEAADIRTLVLPLELDDAFRVSCD